MKDFSTVALLQPITAATPLAGLLNRWLLALAPAAALIDPSRPSAARDCLQDTTTGAHFLHYLVARIITRLEAGKGMQNYWGHIRADRPRRAIIRPFLHEREALALASIGPELHTPQQVHKAVSYSAPFLQKLNEKPCAFAADRELLEMVIEASGTAGWELSEMEGFDMERVNNALGLLRAVMSADFDNILRAEGERESGANRLPMQLLGASTGKPCNE